MPIENLPALGETLNHLGPWLGGGVGGGISLKKPLERLLGAPIDRLLAGYEARTEASKKRTLAVEEVRTREVVEHEEEALAQRALSRIASTARHEQENIEAVAVAAIEDLKADPPPTAEGEVFPEVDDDFLAQLQRAALDASTERVQQLYGRILAGEVRKPGSFSLATLQTLTVYDQATALLFEAWAPRFSSDGYMPKGKYVQEGAGFDAVGLLVDAGLVSANEMLSMTWGPSAPGEFIIPFDVRHGTTVVRLTPPSQQTSLNMQMHRLTTVGAQIRTLVRAVSPDQAILQQIIVAYGEASRPTVQAHALLPVVNYAKGQWNFTSAPRA